MVGKNTDPLKTQFTISVDKIGGNCTTGISAKERTETIKALTNPKTMPEDLARRGHIFPLKAINILHIFSTFLAINQESLILLSIMKKP